MATKKTKNRALKRSNKRLKLGTTRGGGANKKTTPTSPSSEYSTPESIQKLLEPYTKDQLIDFLTEASLTDQPLLHKIESIADQDVSHRKIFVHGLGWDTTQDSFSAAFSPFGEVEECKLVVDRVTGRAKGFGFVMYKTRKCAAKALKEPQKMINNRMVNCQLASLGVGVGQQGNEPMARKVYVSNVGSEVDGERLRALFEKFGEIENGPMGFDVHTGKSRGYALFLYKTVDGAKKALQEPYKMFEGQQLHCQLASKPTMQQPQAQQPLQASALAAAAAAQNLAMFSQHPSLNPAYAGLLMNQSAGLMMNPLYQSGGYPGAGSSLGFGGYGASYGLGGLGGLGGSSSLLGTPSYMNPSLQGLDQYPTSEQYLGQSSSSRTSAFGSSLSGYPPYM